MPLDPVQWQTYNRVALLSDDGGLCELLEYPTLFSAPDLIFTDGRHQSREAEGRVGVDVTSRFDDKPRSIGWR